MNRRLLAAFAGSAVLVATVLPSTAFAADPPQRGQRVSPAKLAEIDPSFRPYLADAKRQLTVVLQLADDPASRSTGSSKAQQKTRAGTLRTRQQGMDKAIKAAGGKVTGRYQYAYNGVRVRAAGKRLSDLAAIKGVVAIRPLKTYTIDNTNAVPYVAAPTAWQANGATGDGVTIAVIDTGIDYTHADFGGPGTTATYDANNPTVIESGIVPDRQGHRGLRLRRQRLRRRRRGRLQHHSGAGSRPARLRRPWVARVRHGRRPGRPGDHSTYTGPYDSSIYAASGKFTVGPGVAPEAKLVALKVFGCEGTTNLVVDALEWVASYNVSHADGIDVVNMSLGAPFGANTDPDAIATNNLVDMGVVVVASAGNESAVPYVTGAPAASTKAISVAALDAFPAIPMATVDLPGSSDISGNNQNAYPGLPVTGVLHVVAGDARRRSVLGCTADDYDAASAGKIVAIRRGDCTFVDKGAAAEAAGAIGIIDVNRDGRPTRTSLPTFIGYNPEEFTIPMIGVDQDARADPASPTRAPRSPSSPPAPPPIPPTRRSPTSARPARAGRTAGSSPTSPRRASTCCRPSTAPAGTAPPTPAPPWPPPSRPGAAASSARRTRTGRRSGSRPPSSTPPTRRRRDRRLRPAPGRRRRRPGQPRGQHQGPGHHQRRHGEPLVRLRADATARTARASGSRSGTRATRP